MKTTPSSWHESLWRKPLTPAERASLANDTDLELEARLTESLCRIPDVPVASNFTARVLATVDHDELSTRGTRWAFAWNWRIVLPRVIATTTLLILIGAVWQHHELQSQRALLARNIAQVAYNKPLPSFEALSNFDAIQRMSQPVAPDKELLALMQ